MPKFNPEKLSGQRTALANASFIKRILAFLVDIMIIQIVIIYPFKKVVEKVLGEKSIDITKINQLAVDPSAAQTLTMISIAVGLLSLLYFILFETKMGQSPGKMFFNIYVTAEAVDNKTKKSMLQRAMLKRQALQTTQILKRLNSISFFQAMLRSLFMIPVFPFALLWILDPLFLFFSQNSQRLTEQLSRTRVVEYISY